MTLAMQTHEFEPVSGIRPVALTRVWPDAAVVLVVTSDDSFRHKAGRAVERAFGARPVVVTFTATEDAALTDAEHNPPDLVIIDSAPGDPSAVASSIMTRIRNLRWCERTRFLVSGRGSAPDTR